MISCYPIRHNSSNGNYIKDGRTSVHWAVWKNSKECLELLLSHGAEVNIRDEVSSIIKRVGYKITIVIIIIIMKYCFMVIVFSGERHHFIRLPRVTVKTV